MPRKLILIFPCQMALFFVVNTHAEDCRQIEKSKDSNDQTVYVKTTGKHCLTYDIIQSRVFDIHAGSFKSLAGRPLLDISYPNEYIDYSANKAANTWMKPTYNLALSDNSIFDIDLQRHLLKGDAENMEGVRAYGNVRNAKIHNGFIDVPGSRNVAVSLLSGTITRISVANKPSPVSVALVEFEDVVTLETVDKKGPTYKPSNYHVELMTIKGGWRGGVMGGANNVLRDSTIEADGHAAIFMYGPGSIIENNTIIIHGQGDAKPFDAAIKLRDAHGAIVRNNRIIYKGGWFGKAPAAINLLDSTDVKIEGNTVEKFEKLVRINGESAFNEMANSLK